jgi:hypothetical protein
MKNAGYFNRLLGDLIYDDVWKRREHQLSSSGHATAGSPEVGKVL